MTAEQPFSGISERFVKIAARVAVLLAAFTSTTARAAISWDAGSGTQYWFDPVNWSNNVLPPSNGAVPPAATDTDITIATTGLPGGEGIVYDPSAGDPNFANVGSQVFPTGFDAQTIQQLYVARAATNTKLPGVPTGDGLITLKGDLTATGNVIIGRSSNVRDVATNGTVIQKGGKFVATTGTMDLAQTETSQDGMGNGTWDYRAGTMDISRDGGSGLRLSNGTNSLALDGQVSGAGGIAKLIIHNPADHLGYVRTFALIFNAYAGNADGVANSFDPNGVTKGVAIAEFHYENGGVRPIQVTQTLTINNGLVDAPGPTATQGVRSARLDIKLDSAPLAPGGIPQNLGLIDVDWNPSDAFVGSITGTGDVDGDGVFNDDRVFSNASAANPLAASAAYNQDSIVSAIFGNTKYNWKISYTGTITWNDVNNSVLNTVTGTGGQDVVLIGLSTETISVGVQGDYNGNGVVDAADYVLWRNGGPLQNEVDAPGTVNANDYTEWKARFGKSSGAGSSLSGGAVPEPQTLILVLCGLSCAVISRRGR
jgi:hypothetical protein